MSKNLRHNKIKNTGLLFELLSRQITVDVLNNKKNSVAIPLIKEFFNSNTALGKELQLYKILVNEKYNSESKAEKLVEAVLVSRQRIKNADLKREKYNLVKAIREAYDINDFFAARIPEFKIYASIYKLFLTETANDVFDIAESMKNKFTIMEYVTTSTVQKKPKATIYDEFKKEEKDLRILSYRMLVEKFNAKYSGSLNECQKKLLREYINNISNTNHLKEFIASEVDRVKKALKSLTSRVDDPVTKIKLTEVLNQIDTLKEGKVVKDEHVVKLMRHYQLTREIKAVLDEGGACGTKG
jgi:hypothetical protein